MKPKTAGKQQPEVSIGNCTNQWTKKTRQDLHQIVLRQAEVHIWRSALTFQEKQIQRLYSLLSEDEKNRTSSYRFEKDRHQFIQGRGMMRILLGAYLGTDPSGLSFQYGPFGKPSLAIPSSDLQFNLSHSCGVTLFAFTRGSEIGIDIEYASRKYDWATIGKNFLTAEEMHELTQHPEREGRKLFYAKWTQMEALLKAMGVGLPGMNNPNYDLIKQEYQIFNLTIGNDFQSAFAVLRSKISLRFFDIHP